MSLDAGPNELFTTTATVADVPALTELVNFGWRHDVGRRAWTTEAGIIDGDRVDEAAIRAAVAGEGSAMRVVRGRQSLTGCVQVARDGESGARIDLLTVRPGMQGALFGRGLLGAAELHAQREFGARVVRIAVLDCREELIGWLERRGYVATGSREPFGASAGAAGVALRDVDLLEFARTLPG